MDDRQAHGWIRAVAVFDLLVTAPMAVPVLSELYVAWLLSGFGLAAAPSSLLPLPLSTAVFVVLTGILALLWNGTRALQPQLALLVRWDRVGRCAVAAALAYFLLLRAAPDVLWLFVASELLGAAIETLALRRRKT